MQPKEIKNIDNFKEFVDETLSEAIDKGSSDIHIEPQKERLLIRFRIDGDIFTFYDIAPSNTNNLVTRLKILAQLKIDEHRLPQDGQIVYNHNREDIDMRVSTFPILYGEKMVIRILKKDTNLLDINSLGFLQLNLNFIKKSLKFKEGLIVASGPTGSGKTTTLYSMLNNFDPQEYNIATLEDPVEYKMEGINQSQVSPDIGYDFSAGLRTLLRQDPDIILVGEIRDKETAMLAIEAALTGHLVFGTIHANRGVGVVERFLNMGIEPYLLASALKLIVSQRLSKKLCKCSKEKELSEEDEKIFKEGLGGIWDSVKENLDYRQPVGCEECIYTGFKGRVGLHEVIYIDNDFSGLMFNDIDHKKWEGEMYQKGYLDLYKDGLLKTAFGLTDLSHILPYKD